MTFNKSFGVLWLLFNETRGFWESIFVDVIISQFWLVISRKSAHT